MNSHTSIFHYNRIWRPIRSLVAVSFELAGFTNFNLKQATANHTLPWSLCTFQLESHEKDEQSTPRYTPVNKVFPYQSLYMTQNSTVPSNLSSSLLRQHAVITTFRGWRHVSQKHHRIWAAKHEHCQINEQSIQKEEKRKWTCMETNKPFIQNPGQFLSLKLSV